jgi:hypothetical protein
MSPPEQHGEQRRIGVACRLSRAHHSSSVVIDRATFRAFILNKTNLASSLFQTSFYSFAIRSFGFPTSHRRPLTAQPRVGYAT